jgi:hypothetical protein
MALICFNKGAQELLTRALNKGPTADLQIQLYKSNTTLSETTELADLTLADSTGYSAAPLIGVLWTITDADPSSASYDEQSFTSSAGSQNQDVYGYVVTDALSTVAIWGETFTDGPYNIVNDGDVIRVTPFFTLD